MLFSQHPGVTYIPISDDEVLAKGGHLEDFSLLIEDPSGRGLALAVVDALRTAKDAQSIHSTVEHLGVELPEVDGFLDELVGAGLALQTDEHAASFADWLGFARFGHLAPGVQGHPLVIAGGTTAERLAAELGDQLKLEARHTAVAGLSDLAEFATELHAEAAPGTADLQQPRLCVVIESVRLSEVLALDERAVASGTPVLYADASGVEWAVGPAVVPGSTACFWEYERQRARSRYSYSEYAVLADAPDSSVPGADAHRVAPVTSGALVAAALPYLVELALTGRSGLAGAVLRGKATTAESQRHTVMRLPRCPVCLPTRPLLRNPLV